MAVLHLQVEIDSDVYPELYAGLAAIARTATREERLRQLAASGLVWEAVRIHGLAVVAAPAAVAAVKKGSSRPAPLPAGRTSAGETPTPTLTPTSRRRAEAPAPEGLDLVLDIPAAVHQAAPGAAPSLRPPGPQGVPVLLDVVDETAERGLAAAGTAQATPQPREQDEAAAADPYPPPLHTGVQRAVPRSARLKRMADRGLFKNG